MAYKKVHSKVKNIQLHRICYIFFKISKGLISKMVFQPKLFTREWSKELNKTFPRLLWASIETEYV